MIEYKLLYQILNNIKSSITEDQAMPATIQNDLTSFVSKLCDNQAIFDGVHYGELPTIGPLTTTSDGLNGNYNSIQLLDANSKEIASSGVLDGMLSNIRQIAQNIIDANTLIIEDSNEIQISLHSWQMIEADLSKGYSQTATGCCLGHLDEYVLKGMSSISEFQISGNGDPGNCRELINNKYIGNVWDDPLVLFDDNYDTIFSYELCKLDEHINVSTKSSTTFSGNIVGTNSLLGKYEISENGRPIKLTDFVGKTGGFANGTKYSGLNLSWSRNPSKNSRDLIGNIVGTTKDDGLYLTIECQLRNATRAENLVITGVLVRELQCIPELYDVEINGFKISLSNIQYQLTNQDVGPDVWAISIPVSLNTQEPIGRFKITFVQKYSYQSQLAYAYLRGDYSMQIGSELDKSNPSKGLRFSVYYDNKFNQYGRRATFQNAPDVDYFATELGSYMDDITTLGTEDARFAVDFNMQKSTYSSGIMPLPGTKHSIILSEIQLINRRYVEKALITTIPVDVSSYKEISINVDDHIPSEIVGNIQHPIKYYIKSDANIYPILPINRSYSYRGKQRYAVGQGLMGDINPSDGTISIVIEIQRPSGTSFATYSPYVKYVTIGGF